MFIEINQHIPSGYSIYTYCSFGKSNNKLSYYRGEDCMKRFCQDLKDHAAKIIDFKKKTMIPLILVIYVKIILIMIKYGTKVISQANIGELHIIRVI